MHLNSELEVGGVSLATNKDAKRYSVSVSCVFSFCLLFFRLFAEETYVNFPLFAMFSWVGVVCALGAYLSSDLSSVLCTLGLSLCLLASAITFWIQFNDGRPGAIYFLWALGVASSPFLPEFLSSLKDLVWLRDFAWLKELNLLKMSSSQWALVYSVYYIFWYGFMLCTLHGQNMHNKKCSAGICVDQWNEDQVWDFVFFLVVTCGTVVSMFFLFFSQIQVLCYSGAVLVFLGLLGEGISRLLVGWDSSWIFLLNLFQFVTFGVAYVKFSVISVQSAKAI